MGKHAVGSMKSIGVFAGTFDPIHNGHLAFAQAALDGGLEKVYFLPEPRPRRKQGVRALEHRLAMINAAIARDKRLGSIKLEQARFTPHDTIPVLQQRFKHHHLVLLFGDDVIQHIADWPQVTTLVDAVSLLIAVRQHKKADLVRTFEVLCQTSGLDFDYGLVQLEQHSISSSRVRAALRQNQPCHDTGEAVIAYAVAHHLYTPQ